MDVLAFVANSLPHLTLLTNTSDGASGSAPGSTTISLEAAVVSTPENASIFPSAATSTSTSTSASTSPLAGILTEVGRVFVPALTSRPKHQQSIPYAWLDSIDPLITLSSSYTTSTTATNSQMFELPSLVELSANDLSLNQAYYGSGHTATATTPGLMLHAPAPHTTTRSNHLTTSSSESMVTPFARSHIIGRFHIRCHDTTNKRGSVKTVDLTFAIQRNHTKHFTNKNEIISAPSNMEDDDIILEPSVHAVESDPTNQFSLSLKYLGHKNMLNPNSHYLRGRFGCVMLSSSLGFYVTTCSNGQDLVRMYTPGWYINQTDGKTSQPPLVLAIDTCYQITVLADDPTASVNCVQEQHHSDLELEWNHRNSPTASVTATPISMGTASNSVNPYSPSSSSSSISLIPQSEIISSMSSWSSPSSSTMVTPFRYHRSPVKVACQHCQAAKTKCDHQRPCARCVRTNRASTCITIESSSSSDSDSDSSNDMGDIPSQVHQ